MKGNADDLQTRFPEGYNAFRVSLLSHGLRGFDWGNPLPILCQAKTLFS